MPAQKVADPETEPPTLAGTTLTVATDGDGVAGVATLEVFG